MPKIQYRIHRFRREQLNLIDTVNTILDDYRSKGFVLTLRQAYYALVARAIIPNTQQSYKRLGDVIDNARLAGMIDWDMIEDRTRNLQSRSRFARPQDVVSAAYHSYHLDRWANQDHRVECWCFDGNTPITTRNGTKAISLVNVGDEVQSHTGHFKPVDRTIQRRYTGALGTIRCTGLLPITCTPNHRFYVRPVVSKPSYKGNKRRYGPPCWKRTDELNSYDLMLSPRRYDVQDVETIAIPPTPRSHSPGTIKVNSDLLRFIGHYLAEGNIRLDGRTVQLTFGKSCQGDATFCRAFASKLGVSSGHAEGRGTIVVYLYSKALARWLTDYCGNGSYQKSMPAWAMHLPAPKQMAMLKAYFNGDGTVDKTTRAISASTRSFTLAQEVHHILVINGYAARINVRQDHGAHLYCIGVSGKSAVGLATKLGWKLPPDDRAWTYNHVSVDQEFACYPVRSVSYHKVYRHPVYNLEVADDHSYCVPVAAHNCEKDALAGVFSRVCRKWDVPLFPCRGYTSQSEMWRAAMRLRSYEESDQTPVIIHFGDHDPSGMDMTEDIRRRMDMFGCDVTVERLALNMDQIQQYSPPPNPAKHTDARFKAYMAAYGNESWELDALDPTVLAALVEAAVTTYRDPKTWKETVEREIDERSVLKVISEKWSDVQEHVELEYPTTITDAEDALESSEEYKHER